jgi:hypothetical protein
MIFTFDPCYGFQAPNLPPYLYLFDLPSHVIDLPAHDMDLLLRNIDWEVKNIGSEVCIRA